MTPAQRDTRGLRHSIAKTVRYGVGRLRATGGQIPGESPGPLFRPSTRARHAVPGEKSGMKGEVKPF